jgi:N-acyl-D-amino-acid deacylase
MYDIIIKNGTIIDGTGKPMYKADIGIKENKIAKIGKLSDEKWEIEIDATEKLICPGFIDVNNHSDSYWQIFINPDLESLVYQGITTIVGGNCGSSLAPLADAHTIASIQKWADINKVNVDWLTLEEFLKIVAEKKLSVNFATLVGHGTLRRGILKDQMRNPNSKEINFIEKMLGNAMNDGALGMSTGLVYTHARSASTEELVNLSKIIKKYDGVYVTHMRSERDEFITAVEEAIKIGEEANVKLHISHLKVMGEKNWKFMDEALLLLDKAKERGMDVSFDVFPYTNTGTVLYTLLPEWVTDGGKKMMLGRLKDLQIRPKIVEAMRESDIDYDKIDIAISSLNKTLVKRKISEIAAAQEKSVEDVVIDILIASDGRVITSMEVLNPENVKKAIQSPLSMISSNGSGYNIAHSKTGELVHPRSFGTFARVLSKYVLGERIMSWEEAIKKMTSIPAQKFGIKERGQVVEKYFADLIILNRDTIDDLATVDNPYQYSKGIEIVMVNGQLVVSDGKYTGIRAGEVIKK